MRANVRERTESQQRTVQNESRDAEIDDQAGDIHKRRHERSRGAGGIEAETAKYER